MIAAHCQYRMPPTGLLACPGFRRQMLSFTLERRYRDNIGRDAMLDHAHTSEPTKLEDGP